MPGSLRRRARKKFLRLSRFPDRSRLYKAADPCYTLYRCAPVAQWIEHQIPVLRAGGSSPFRRATASEQSPLCSDVLFPFGPSAGTGVKTISVIQSLRQQAKNPLNPAVIQRERSDRRIPRLVAEGNDTYSYCLLSFSHSAAPVSDANPAQRIAAEKEEQGSERSFRRKEEAESSGLCDDAIPRLVAEGNDNVLLCPSIGDSTATDVASE